MARWMELVPLDDLLARPALRNPKSHDDEGIDESFSRHGVVENPALDERTGRLVAGHGRLNRLAAWRERGEQPPDGVELADDGQWLVPTQRGWSSRSDSDAEAYVVTSNSLTIKGGWDEALLAEMMGEYTASDPEWLLGTGWDEREVVTFLASTGGGESRDAGDPDDVPEPPDDPTSRLGDLWLLGDHRVLCGDSTAKVERDRLLDGARLAAILTDPPYAFGLASTSALSAKSGGWHDMMNNASWFRDRYQEWASLVGNGPAWVFGNWRTLPILMRAVFEADLSITSVMVWHKDWIGPGGTRGLRPSWELVTLSIYGDYSIPDRGVPDLLTVPWSSFKPTGHGAEKPVELFRRLLEISAVGKGKVVFDPFLGSGTCLMAAETEGARCVGSELNERHVDTICARFQRATGIVPVLEATGQPHDFLAE